MVKEEETIESFDQKIFDERHKTALSYAIEENQDVQALKILLYQYHQLEGSRNDSLSSYTKVKKLFFHYLTEAKKKNNEMSPLHLAVQEEDGTAVNLFIKYGVYINALDKDNRTPLDLATIIGSLPIATALLKSRPDPSIFFKPKKENGFTPLHLAVENGQPDILELFLKTGIPIDLDSKNGLKLLHLAVLKNDKNMVLMLLKFGAVVDVPGRNEFETPLFVAAEIGNSEIVEILAEASTKRSSNWIEGYPSLCIAAYHGHEEVVKILLDKDVNPNTVYGEFLSPLHAAAQRGYPKIVELLVERGAYVNLPRKLNRLDPKFISTPLLAATLAGHTEIVHFLLEKGANPDVQIGRRDNFRDSKSKTEQILISGDYQYNEIINQGSIVGFTCLHFAAKTGNQAIFDLLMERGASLNLATERGLLVLGFAVEREDEEMIRKLLRSGVNVFLRHRDRSILSIKSLKTNPRLAELILKYGSASHHGMGGNVTALGLAVEYQLEKNIEILLEANVDPNIEYKRETVLHTAVKTQNSGIVRLLIKHGVNLNVCTNMHDTALSVAILRNDETIIQDLLDAGADTKLIYEGKKYIYGPGIYASRQRRYEALNLAIVKGRMKIVEMLLKKESLDSYRLHRTDPLCLAVRTGNLEIVEKLIAFGASIHGRGRNEKPPIFYAIEGSNVDIFRLLLKRGASPNAKTPDGSLLFNSVAASRHIRKDVLLELLLDYGVEVNDIDKSGFSPLQSVLSCENPNSLSRVKFLLDDGANPNCRSSIIGRTVLENAIHQKETDLIRLLLLYGADVNLLNKKGKTPLQIAIAQDRLETSDILRERKTIRLLTREIARRKAANEEVHEKNVNGLDCQFTESFFKECEEEIEKMKKSEINPGLTYFDILIAKNHELSAYARNEKVLEVLTGDGADVFCEYKDFLISRIEMGKNRRELREASYGLLLDKILRFELPSLIVDYIFRFLSNRDLRNLDFACRNDMYIQ